MADVIVVGAGYAFQKYYLGAISRMPDVLVAGIVDRVMPSEVGAHELLRTAWKVEKMRDIPREFVSPDTIVLVLTPDHYPCIRELAEMGFTNMAVEKPFVSRYGEVESIRHLMTDRPDLRLYAMDSYINKLLPLLYVLERLGAHDPRLRFLKASGEFSGLSSCVGQIQGISIAIIEAGNFCLPDLAKRPWLERDSEIGGMLLDLGTHALAPLVAAGLLGTGAQVHDVKLSKLSSDRRSLIPLQSDDEVEMYVSALLTAGDLPIQVAFGKVPFHGGVWTLAIRGERGMIYAGLRSGQSVAVVPDSGDSIILSLTKDHYAIALEEALMYFRGELPGFDGYAGAFFSSMEILHRMRRSYFAHAR